jgi:hypothetical protein
LIDNLYEMCVVNYPELWEETRRIDPKPNESHREGGKEGVPARKKMRGVRRLASSKVLSMLC